MANVLDVAAGTFGFLHAMGQNNGVGTLTNAQACTALTRAADRFDFISSYSPAPVALNFAARNNVFINTFFDFGCNYADSPTSSGGSGFPAKMIVFYNTAGKPIFSLGNVPIGTKPAAFNNSSAFRSNIMLYIFFYGDADANVPISYEQLGTSQFPMPVISNLNFNSINQLFSINYVWDAVTPSNSKLEVFFNNNLLTVADVATKLQVTDKQVTKVTFGGWATTGASAVYYGTTPVRYIIAMDGVDYTAKAAVLYPTAFTANNTFSGAITAVNTNTQDTTYVASSSEVSAVFEVELADFVSVGKSDRVMRIDLLAFMRYVQSGGTAIAFTCALVDEAGRVHASAVVNVAANETETMCRVNKALTAITSQVTSGSFSAALVQAMRIRISI